MEVGRRWFPFQSFCFLRFHVAFCGTHTRWLPNTRMTITHILSWLFKTPSVWHISFCHCTYPLPFLCFCDQKQSARATAKEARCRDSDLVVVVVVIVVVVVVAGGGANEKFKPLVSQIKTWPFRIYVFFWYHKRMLEGKGAAIVQSPKNSANLLPQSLHPWNLTART